MRIKNSIFIVILFTSFFMKAQTNKIKIGGGLAFSNFASPVLTDQKFKKGNHFNASFERESEKHFLYSIGLSYSSFGSILPSFYIDNLGNVTNFDFTLDFNYLEIPLSVGKRFGDDWFGFGNIGVVNRFLLFATQNGASFNQENETTSEQTTDISNDVQSYDLGILLELGFG